MRRRGQGGWPISLWANLEISLRIHPQCAFISRNAPNPPSWRERYRMTHVMSQPSCTVNFDILNPDKNEGAYSPVQLAEGFDVVFVRSRSETEEILREAVGRLQLSLHRAVDVMADLLDAEEKTIRLRAAQGIIENFFRIKETNEFEERLEKIEAVLFERKGAAL